MSKEPRMVWIERTVANELHMGKRTDPFMVSPQLTEYIRNRIDQYVQMPVIFDWFPQREVVEKREKAKGTV